MKILFVGVLDIHWSTNLEMKRGLEKLGHSVEDFNYRTVAAQQTGRFGLINIRLFDRLASRLRRVRWLPGLLSDWYWNRSGRGKMRRLLIDRVKSGNFGLVLFAKTDTLHFDAVTEVRRYCPTWFYFMDPSERASRVLAREYAVRANWASASSSAVVDDFTEYGSRVFHMVQGVDTDRFRRSVPSSSGSIVFAGTRTPEREYWINQINSAGFAVNCFGAGWKSGPKYADDLVDEYHRAAIVLNFCQDRSIYSVRVAQAMACGSFVLTQKCDDLADHFQRAEHIDWFETPDEMKEKLAYYLENEGVRHEIAVSGTKLVHETFGWEKKMAELMLIVESGISK